MTDDSSPRPDPWWPVWGLFCAASWTWCIGMYLPRIMLERHGWAGFLVFAIPNVLGCAGLGYVLRTRAASESLVAAHRPAMRWFSFVTIAFHAFFVVFLTTRLAPLDAFGRGPGPGSTRLVDAMAFGGLGVAVLAACGLVLARLGDRGWLRLTLVVMTASIVALAFLATRPTTLGTMPVLRDGTGVELLMLAPVVVLGFLLCPYLDLTFHRAHQRSAGTHAFGVFGLAFAAMIVGTCILWERPAPVLGWVALGHLAIQGTFTVGAHLRELDASLAADAAPATLRRRLAWLGGPFLVGLAFIPVAHPGLPVVGEGSYMRFIGAYGLVFPAYVLLFMVAGVRMRPTPRALLAFGAVCVVLAPLFELAFLGRRSEAVLLPAGLAVAWALGRRLRPGAVRADAVRTGEVRADAVRTDAGDAGRGAPTVLAGRTDAS